MITGENISTASDGRQWEELVKGVGSRDGLCARVCACACACACVLACVRVCVCVYTERAREVQDKTITKEKYYNSNTLPYTVQEALFSLSLYI